MISGEVRSAASRAGILGDHMLFWQSRIKLAMSRRETALYRRVVRNRSGIVEFGCGGSTLLALRYCNAKIYSVDSERMAALMTEQEPGNVIPIRG